MDNNNNLPSFRNLYAFNGKQPADLSLSENPLGCSFQAAKVLKNITRKDFSDYPDPDSINLIKIIKKRLGIRSGGIFAANGSEAIIKLIPQIFLRPGDEAVIPRLTFPMFAIAVSLAGGKVVFSEMTSDFDIDLQDIRKRITGKTKIVFLCNPNNPTGRIIKRRNLIDFFKSVSVLTVVDEANIEFGGESVVGEVDKRGNIIVLRTFSKGFGLAGIRVGFCAAARDIISEMKRSSQPFLLSSISQKAALAAFSDRQFIKRTKIFMDKERNFLIKGLLRVGLRNVPSEANNLIVKLPVPSSLFCAKLEKRGISVVDGKFFTFPQGSFIRVSPRLRKTNRIFLKAAYEIMKEINKP